MAAETTERKWQLVTIDKVLYRKVKALAADEGRYMSSILKEALTTGPVGERIARLDTDNKAA